MTVEQDAIKAGVQLARAQGHEASLVMLIGKINQLEDQLDVLVEMHKRDLQNTLDNPYHGAAYLSGTAHPQIVALSARIGELQSMREWHRAQILELKGAEPRPMLAVRQD